MSTDAEKIMIMDMGIAINLPFSVALRPERGIEMFLVFDWSAKIKESEHPFTVSFDSNVNNVVNVFPKKSLFTKKL